jgi:hypothetical protein
MVSLEDLEKEVISNHQVYNLSIKNFAKRKSLSEKEAEWHILQLIHSKGIDHVNRILTKSENA